MGGDLSTSRFASHVGGARQADPYPLNVFAEPKPRAQQERTLVAGRNGLP